MREENIKKTCTGKILSRRKYIHNRKIKVNDQGPLALSIIQGAQDPMAPQDPQHLQKPSNSSSTSGPSCTSSTTSATTTHTAYATIKLFTF